MRVIGRIEGNIIAAIITTQTPRNQPSPPRSVPGPASIPFMRSPVMIQARIASATKRPMRPSWTARGRFAGFSERVGTIASPAAERPAVSSDPEVGVPVPGVANVP